MADVLRVFISSTSLDLKDHRQRAMDACLRQNMLPVMMEYLPAADADAVEVSLKMVEDADVYLGIYGRRYGFIPEGYDKSITQLEYERAVELGLPLLIFIMDDSHPVEPEQVDTGEAGAKLATFIDRLKHERVVNFFESPDTLLAGAINSLSYLRTTAPRGTQEVARVEVGSAEFSDPIKEAMLELNKTITRLTDEQYRVLDYLSGQRRVAITGCAGSGKTLIAMEKAIRLTRAGLRTLVLCHNPYLAEYMRTLAKGARVEVYDFAEWIGQLTGKSIQNDSLDDDGSSGGTWTHFYWPSDDDLLEAAEMLQNSQRYDAVIVDEGQDFRDEWWLVVEAALVNPAHDILYIFHDNNQALLPHQTKYPVAQSPIVLSQNCRNAGHIFDWVRQFHFRLEQNSPPELAGQGIVHKTVFAAGEELDAIREAVQEALTSLKPEQLIVLSAEVMPAEESILNGLEVTQRFNWTWQEAVTYYLQSCASNYDSKRPLPDLSDAPIPTEDDVSNVTHYARQLLQRAFPSQDEKRLADEARRIWWLVEANKFELSPAPHPRHASLIRQWLVYFTSDHWARGLPVPKTYRLSAVENDRAGTPENTIRLFSVSSYKGLESDAVILFVQSPREKLRSNLYVGLSRARFLLHLVIDPVSNARLPPLDAPTRRMNRDESEGDE